MALSDLQGTTIVNTVLASLNEASVSQAVFGGDIAQAAINARKGAVVRVPKAESLEAVEYDGTDMDFNQIGAAYADVTLDQAWAVPASLDDVDDATLTVDVLGPTAIEMGVALAGKIDSYTLGVAVDAATALTGDHTVDGDYSAYDLVSDLQIALDEANVPDSNRYLVVPAAFAGLLARDNRVLRSTPAGDAAVVTGRIGEACGFTIVRSNRIDGDTVLAAHGSAVAFAQAVSKFETARSERSFKTLLKALAVFGAGVIRPETLVKATWRVSGS